MRQPDIQCCVCLATCQRREDSAIPGKWKPHDRLLSTSHGYCPKCGEAALAEARKVKAGDTI